MLSLLDDDKSVKSDVNVTQGFRIDFSESK